MSVPKEPPPAKLMIGLLFSEFGIRDRAMGSLVWRFGPLDFLTEAQPFSYTAYYDREMGAGIVRQVCSFLNLVPQESLPDLKRFTNQLEVDLSLAGKRRINLDPGLLSTERLVLATGKNYTHRIYLRDGIYADLTLLYQAGTYQKLPWTYPDYQEPSLIHFLCVLRQKLHFQQQGRLPARP
jgi:hypothetical protein